MISKRFTCNICLAILLLVFSQLFQEATAKELGEDCASSQECKDGSSGDLSICGPENTCICNANSVPDIKNTTCLEKVNIIGDPCKINAQCIHGSLGNQSYCDFLTGNVCRCNLLTSIPNQTGNNCLPIRNTIGAPCEQSPQCQRGLPGFNSLCKKEENSEGTCQCDDYSVTAPGQHICLLKRDRIGEPCTSNIQCTINIGDLSECSSRSCQCRENEAIGNADETKCLKAEVSIGQPCEETAQCVGLPNSVCSTSKRCDCIREFVPSSPLDDCLPIVNELGKHCMESQQCSSGIPGSLSACNENECRCIENATSGPNEHVCRAKAVYVGDSCVITAQCTANLEHSYCQGDKCVCLPGAVTSGNGMKCLLKAYLGEECEEDNQCSHVDHSLCTRDEVDGKHTCQCDSGYIADPSGRTCQLENETAKVGQPCRDSSVCPGIPGISSGCSASGYCSCFGGFVHSRDLDDCLPIRNSLGDNCVQQQQCQLCEPGIYSTCANNVCNCTGNAISVIEGDRCYRKAVMVGDQCNYQEQCVANLGASICIEGICQCFEGYKQSADNTKCI